MPIRVQYNADLKFRRSAAFRNFYRARNSYARLGIEMAVMVACLIACAVIWASKTSAPIPNYIFYICAIAALFIFCRVIRMLATLTRIKPLGESAARREYHFFDNGFRFGPINPEGEMLETRWREVDRAYHVGSVVYLLCKGRSQWAPIDFSLILEGSPDKLLTLLKTNITGSRFRSGKK